MINTEVSNFKLDNFLSYIYDHITEDAKRNTSLDMDDASYYSLYQRLLKLCISEPKLETILTFGVIASIIFVTAKLGEVKKMPRDIDELYTLGNLMVFTFAQTSEKEYTEEQINQLLINRYNFLVENCTLSKFTIVVHEYETLVGKNMN